MMGIEDKLLEEIKRLEEMIEHHETNEEWRREDAEGRNDTNRYFWDHDGGHDNAIGEIDGLKKALELLGGPE